MTSKELDLILSHLDTMNQKIDDSNRDIKGLDRFIRDHMDREERAMHMVDKRISKLEWKANGISVIFGVIGGIISSKIYAIFGINKS
jgi:hypothetical protein